MKFLNAIRSSKRPLSSGERSFPIFSLNSASLFIRDSPQKSIIELAVSLLSISSGIRGRERVSVIFSLSQMIRFLISVQRAHILSMPRILSAGKLAVYKRESS